MTNNDNNYFRTSDTSLAAYLISEHGYAVYEIDYISDSRRAILIFKLEADSDKDKIDKIQREFYTLKSRGNIQLFQEAYRKLARTIKNELPV